MRKHFISPFLAAACFVGSGLAGGSLAAQEEPARAEPVPETSSDARRPETEPKAETETKSKPERNEYVVQSGDNPWTIAKEHGITLEQLLAANKIEDAKRLKIGDVLNLPLGIESKNEVVEAAAEENSEEAETATAAAEPREGDDWELYTVKQGDNPWTIAKRLEVEHQAIVKLNKGRDFQKLKVGEEIKVPRAED
ncbi:MAG: LysM peptidoglycan-binding domain-containing protein [Verrucomicrobiales bacterium]